MDEIAEQSSASQGSRTRKKARKGLRGWAETVLPRLCARLVVAFWRLAGDWKGLRPVLMRTSAHVAVITVSCAVLVLGSVRWPSLSASARPGPSEDPLQIAATPVQEPTLDGTVLTHSAHTWQLDSVSMVTLRADPHTTIPVRPRLGVITYTVQVGDTIEAIAGKFTLQPTTLMWANPAVEDLPDLLRVGQEVVILPIDGVYHTVGADDTLDSIADKYKVDVAAITSCEYNHLKPPVFRIAEGQQLIVPGGEKPYLVKVVTSYTGPVPEGAHGTGLFQWPVLGSITQGYFYGHRAIDIGVPTGTALRAADSGFVSFAGWTDVGYGYLIVVDHGNGFATYYGHLSAYYVAPGQAVERGQVIGATGNTGWSTGPHLHFEIRYAGVMQNPRAYLP